MHVPNLKKNGVSLEEAQSVFYDEFSSKWPMSPVCHIKVLSIFICATACCIGAKWIYPGKVSDLYPAISTNTFAPKPNTSTAHA
jgi:hypothetical protein